jgi:hypothetical protein
MWYTSKEDIVKENNRITLVEGVAHTSIVLIALFLVLLVMLVCTPSAPITACAGCPHCPQYTHAHYYPCSPHLYLVRITRIGPSRFVFALVLMLTITVTALIVPEPMSSHRHLRGGWCGHCCSCAHVVRGLAMRFF